MHFFEIPELDIPVQRLQAKLLSADILDRLCQSWENPNNKIFWNIPLHEFAEEITFIQNQIALAVNPRLFVFKPSVVSKPHTDRIRNVCINIGLQGNFAEDPSVFTDEDGSESVRLNYKIGRAYCVDVSRPHSGQSIHSHNRAILSLTFANQFNFQDIQSLYEQQKLIRREQTLEFWEEIKAQCTSTDFDFSADAQEIRRLLQQQISSEFEFYWGRHPASDTPWFVWGRDMRADGRYYFSGHLSNVLVQIQDYLGVPAFDLMKQNVSKIC